MRARCAHRREGCFPALSDPQNLGGGFGPRRALSFCRSVWQAKKALAKMSSIQFNGATFKGPADDDFGDFSNPDDGRVFAGSHANGSARFGVCTWADGNKFFVECDADGKPHGRNLLCYADGATGYRLFEHGGWKEEAVLAADGNCYYNGEICLADFPPFVKLKAKVLPIKARPIAHSRRIPHSPHIHPVPHRPPIRPSAMF
jgi:hypothetical protein